MSFQIPSRVPAFDVSHRDAEDGQHWRPNAPHRHQSTSSGSGFMNNFMNPAARDLPMYKDKPYFSPRGTGPAAAARRRRKRGVWVAVCALVLVLVWVVLGRGGGGDGNGDGEEGAKMGVREKAGMNLRMVRGGDLWRWMRSFEGRERDKEKGREKGVKVDWAEKRERVRDVFVVSWDAYEQDAWGRDIYMPINKKGRDMISGGMGWMIVDALDTLMIMNLTSKVQHAREWIHTSLHYDQDNDVNTFETTIRMLGGLLSAHYLSTTYPDLAPISDDDAGSPGEDLYIEKATDLADRLLGAFDSPSGIPYASLNLNTSTGVLSHADNGASSTAEAATVQLEFKYLAKLTGEANYWETVERVMKVIEANGVEDGLVPIFIYADTGKFMGENIRLGSRGDSYYEYLIKQYLQTSEQEPVYLDLWDEALEGIRKHLIAYTKEADLMIIGERPSGLRDGLSPKMDHLLCFMPGTIALGATGGLPVSEARKLPTWGQKQEDEMLLAKELMKTCWATYIYTETGLAPEITYFKLDDPPRMLDDLFPPDKNGKKKALHEVSKPLSPLDDKDAAWRKDIYIKPADRHNLQRPETVESLLYMYRITGDEMYRHWGWEMFKNFIKHTAVTEKPKQSSDYDEPQVDDDDDAGFIRAFTSLSNCNILPAVQRDNMESFWLAETLKYFYLLFSERDFIPLETTVFNTEAHPFPRFEMGKLFKTGWERKNGKKE